MTGMAGTGTGFTVSGDMINGFANRLSGRSETVSTAASQLGMVEVTPDMFGPAAHEQGFTTAMAQTTQRITNLLSRSAEAIEDAAVGTKKTAEQYDATEQQNTMAFNDINGGMPGAPMPPAGGPMMPGGGMGPMPGGPGVAPLDPLAAGGPGMSQMGPMPGGPGVAPLDPLAAGGPGMSQMGPIPGGPAVSPMDPMAAGGPGMSQMGPMPGGPPVSPTDPMAGGGQALNDPAAMLPEIPPMGGSGAPPAPGGTPLGMTDPSAMTPTMPPMPGGPGPSSAPTPQQFTPQQFTPPPATPIPTMPTPPTMPGNQSPGGGPAGGDKARMWRDIRDEGEEHYAEESEGERLASRTWQPPDVPEPPTMPSLEDKIIDRGPVVHPESPYVRAEYAPNELVSETTTDAANADKPLRVTHDLPGGGGISGGGGGGFSGGGGGGSLPSGGPGVVGGGPAAPGAFTGTAPPPGVAMSGAQGGGIPAGMPGGPGGPGGGGAPMGGGGMPMGGMGGGGGQGGDQERKTAAYVKGEEMFKAPEGNLPPPVIGATPPQKAQNTTPPPAN